MATGTRKTSLSAPAEPAPPGRRKPAKSIEVLLPVWGYDFAEQFLERCLPTLLAPGNLPALARLLPTEFVFLTRKEDEAMIRQHPNFALLEKTCAVGFLAIDDLITDGNHSTTVTLGYTRAVRRRGAAMLDTCFFFLVSDYIIADGSLASVLARMQAGASAVQAGNFQLDERAAAGWLRQRLDRAAGRLALPPRELMRWALGCLHPATAANIVNYPICHNAHTNRLFWRVDDDTLIGRFYLLHMICIRPEIVDFAVGASCDYSFVSEMCPSGNVVTMTDSDDYLVLEVQPRRHESHFLRGGAAEPEAIAASLAEWTTAGHRANVRDTVVFHAADPPRSLAAAIAAADEFIARVAQELPAKPKPHRDHPYWRGAMAAFETSTGRRYRDEHGLLIGAPEPRLLDRLMRWARGSLVGRLPEVRRLHPRWSDLNVPLAEFKVLTADPERRLLIVAGGVTPLIAWLRERAGNGVYLPVGRLLRPRPGETRMLASFDACLVDMTDADFGNIDRIIDRIVPLLRPGAEVLVLSLNRDWGPMSGMFAGTFAANAAGFLRAGLWSHGIHMVFASRMRWQVNSACVDLLAAIFGRPLILLPFRVAAAAILMTFAVSLNLASSWRANRPGGNRVLTSVLVRFRTPTTRAQGGEADRAYLAAASGLERSEAI